MRTRPPSGSSPGLPRTAAGHIGRLQSTVRFELPASLPPVCVATGPAVGGVSVAVLPELVDGHVCWWQVHHRLFVPHGHARRALPLHTVLSDRPFVFDDAAGRGPTALVPLTLDRYRRLVQHRLGGPDFEDPDALERWILGRYRLTA